MAEAAFILLSEVGKKSVLIYFYAMFRFKIELLSFLISVNATWLIICFRECFKSGMYVHFVWCQIRKDRWEVIWFLNDWKMLYKKVMMEKWLRCYLYWSLRNVRWDFLWKLLWILGNKLVNLKSGWVRPLSRFLWLKKLAAWWR